MTHSDEDRTRGAAEICSACKRIVHIDRALLDTSGDPYCADCYARLLPEGHDAPSQIVHRP